MITVYPARSFYLVAALVAAPLTVAQLGVTVLTGPSKTASATLTVSSATAAIQSCAYEARGQLLFDMESRLKEADEPLRNLSASGQTLPDPQRDEFSSALEAIKLQEGVLRMGMEAAHNANAKTWPQVRATLAFNYMDYVGAVSRLELLIHESEGNRG